jgi:drug/metabolite transporter (DMT)-like permease
MLLNLTSVTVMILEYAFNGKKPSRRQLLGVSLALIGAFLFFKDSIGGFNIQGVAITLLSGVGWAGYMVSGRKLFKEQNLSPLGSSAFTMGFGTAILSTAAFFFEGFSSIPLSGWAIIIWLGVVNTAVAFFLWNYALERIDAFRLSVLQNTMLIQITILSIVFLGETYSLAKYIYMGILFTGVYIVQTESTSEDSN